MAKIEVFTGSVSLVGVPRGVTDISDTDAFYRDKITAYGVTPGELLDNLVEASVKVAENLFTWTLQNKPASYIMGSDHWVMSAVYPSLELKDDSFSDAEIGGFSTVSSVEGVVHFAVLIRDITIGKLILQLMRSSQMPLVVPAKPYKDIHTVASLREKTACGYQSTDLEAVLKLGLGLKDEVPELKDGSRAPSAPKQSWWKKR